MTNLRPLEASDEGVDEQSVMRLAETTEVSPQQARDLLKKHNGDFEEAEREAAQFRAEG